MVKIKMSSGYSAEVLRKYIAGDEDVFLAGVVVETQYKFVDGKRTDDISGYQVYIATNNLNPFKIKFESEPDLSGLKIGDKVTLVDAQAIEIRGNVYFKANAIKKA